MALSVTFELLDSARHRRDEFSSGVGQVDRFLRKTAGKLMKGGTARVFVAVEYGGDPGRILGFFSINAHTANYSELPQRYKRYSLPNGHIPAAFIGMMGVAADVQGKGIGGLLLVEALRAAHRASQHLGTAVVMLDVLDCGDSSAVARRLRLYRDFGFEPLPSQPLRLFMPMATVDRLIEEDEGD